MPKDSPEVAARKLKRAVERGDIDSHTASAEISRLEGLRPPSGGISSRHSAGRGYVASNREGDDGGDLVEAVAGVAVETAVGVALGETPGEALAGAVVDEIVDTVFGED
jgi:hypothetical protein